MTSTDQRSKSNTFETGRTYYIHWVSDHTFRPLVTVTKRTSRFVTIEDEYGETKRCGITTIDGEEIAYPMGRYSLCPILRASNLAPMHCTEYVTGDPAGCARCGECFDEHEGAR